ncbi:type II toxin-antitoxin system RelE/ParE family toxin [Salinarimonas ramus]|uniref:Phage-related protein n=1 Tax=Salinarimonas ramus TaxID=690164 RepID=A0A917V3K3_9HYPH|nr:type II toxin-antitoxin system RelE/ParE family toxin [Salinarimonas ramus]GGK30896.1 hypothetical protein GCM10011322_16840 [Salinarimonas ramus]
MASDESEQRPLYWVGSSLRDLRGFPAHVQDAFGFALHLVQEGLHPRGAKNLRGLGPGIMELREEHEGRAFRAVYVARFEQCVYVLHTFVKKSRSGISTPSIELDRVKYRLREAEADYANRFDGR